jgi:hypothetical protein
MAGRKHHAAASGHNRDLSSGRLQTNAPRANVARFFLLLTPKTQNPPALPSARTELKYTILAQWPFLRELNAQKETLTAEIARLNAHTPRAVPFAKPSEETVTAYVEDLRSTLNEGSIMQRKA